MSLVSRGYRYVSALVILLIGVTGASASFAQSPTSRHFTATSLTPQSIVHDNSSKDGKPQQAPNHAGNLGSVLVKLKDAPLASYKGNLPGLAATSPTLVGGRTVDSKSAAGQQYLAYLEQQQRGFEAQLRAALPQAHVVHFYQYAFGGVSVIAPQDQLARIAQLPGVVRIYNDEMQHPQTEADPQFIGAPAIWKQLGGQKNAGENVIVGVIDTGIWPEHPSFADNGNYPPIPPFWSGYCEQPHDSEPPINCTRKLIGAREFLDTYKQLTGLVPGEFDSARDNDGHGTHTTSTAAGNPNVPASIFNINRGLVTGIAPKARVAAYKALGQSGGYDSDIVAAINQAVADGVNVINYSVGGGGTNPYTEVTDQAFLDAYAAGVFVAASAGNSGPTPSTVDNDAGWVTTVGASTYDQQFKSTLTLKSGASTITIDGSSITPGVTTFTSVISNTADPLCLNPLPVSLAKGNIVVCERGNNARIDKSYNVLQGQGAGMILYNPSLADTETDNFWVPGIHIAQPQPLVNFLSSHNNVVGKFTQGQTAPAQGDVMAAFSSRGPDPNLAFIKPDITAPGVQILNGDSPDPVTGDITHGPPGQLFQAIAGTSMSSPHIAGSAALLYALHPNWTPGQVKSALMTTATNQHVVKEDTTTPADPYDDGSGRVDLNSAGDPGLTFNVTDDEYRGALGHIEQLNYPSIFIGAMPGREAVTRVAHSELNVASVWSITPTAPAGVTIDVSPKTLTVPAHQNASFVVTIDAKNVPFGNYFGSIDLKRTGVGADKATLVHMPVAFVRGQAVVSLDKSCVPATIAVTQDTKCTITVGNNSPSIAQVDVRDQVPSGLQVIPSTVHGGLVTGNTVVAHNRLAPATIGVNSTPGQTPGYFPLESLGITPQPCDGSCDDVGLTFTGIPSFTYGGNTYSQVTVTSNGYLNIGTDTTVSAANQRFPDPTPPNNVIAPYWTDLDLAGTNPNDPGGGQLYVATLTDGVSNWLVAEWANAQEFGTTGTSHSFEAWITLGNGPIYLEYGPNTATAPLLTVGAENISGTTGTNYYAKTASDPAPTGTPPTPGTELTVSFVPSAETISFRANGATAGTYVNTAEMSSQLFKGRSYASATVVVKP